jgi:hypothetical protein
MKLQIKRRARAARAAMELGRPETDAERQEREELELHRERAARFKALIEKQPMRAWFPSDSDGSAWIPSFYTMRRGE